MLVNFLEVSKPGEVKDIRWGWIYCAGLFLSNAISFLGELLIQSCRQKLTAHRDSDRSAGESPVVILVLPHSTGLSSGALVRQCFRCDNVHCVTALSDDSSGQNPSPAQLDSLCQDASPQRRCPRFCIFHITFLRSAEPQSKRTYNWLTGRLRSPRVVRRAGGGQRQRRIF